MCEFFARDGRGRIFAEGRFGKSDSRNNATGREFLREM